jgi:[ribosomal protein S18]-alanine N-acetyltransferase
MTARPATQADAAYLSRLHTLSFDDGWTQADFTTWLSRSEAMAIVVADEREPVAFGLALQAGDDAELLTIATDPARRGQGMGRRVFRALDELAGQRTLNRWILEVARNNLPALGLYRSEGFVEIGMRKLYYQTREGRVDALVMSRPVGPQGGQGAG